MSSMRQWLASWWQRRLPPARQRTLGQAHIFIVPTRTGLAFAGALLLMLLVAINYQNSLAYALVFMLGSLGLLSALHTWRNLAGLQLTALPAEPCFAGQTLFFPVALGGRRHARQGIRLELEGQPAVVTDVPRGQQNTVLLPWQQAARGVRQPGRMRVESRFPLGIWVAWSRVELEQQALVYPAPLEAALPPLGSRADGEEEGVQTRQPGVDDYQGLASWQKGDSMRRVDWKAWSRGQGLWVRQFAETAGSQTLLDFATLSGDSERRLSVLCFHVLRLAAAGQVFGLALPGQVLAPDQGPLQRDACLAALARFGSNRS